MSDDRQDLLCTQCGASLQLPGDPTAKSVRCSFCHHTNLLPERVVRETSSRGYGEPEGTEVPPKALALVLVAALVVAIGSIGAAVLFAGPSVGIHTGVRSDPDDPSTTGEARAQQIVADLKTQGCHQLLPATVHQGRRELGISSNQTSGFTCDRYVAVSAYEDVKLEISVKRPDGTMTKVPPPSNELQLELCRKSIGQYWVRVESSTSDHFTFAQLSCPAPGL